MFLALKEMRRAKLRFGLLTGAVALLIFLILFQQALLTGLINQFIGALKNQSAQVLVYNEQARKNVEGSLIFPDQSAAVAQVDGVAAAAPLGQGTFTATADGKVVDAVLFGYQLGGPGAPTTLIEGRLPERSGEGVASSRNRDEGFDIGDTVSLASGGGDILVVGLAEEINYSVAPVLFVDFATFEQAKLARNPDAKEVLPSLLAVSVVPGTDAADVAEAITAAVPGAEALTRQQAIDSSPGVSSVRQSFAIILALFYLVVPLVTGLFFLIITFQKASALTLLRAIGAGGGTLVRSLLVQVVVIVVAGGALASLLFFGATKGGGSLGLTFSAKTVVLTVAAVLALAFLTSLVAVRRVLRIDPIQATTGAGVKV
jgi:putative ABC transport system permease protein